VVWISKSTRTWPNGRQVKGWTDFQEAEQLFAQKKGHVSRDPPAYPVVRRTLPRRLLLACRGVEVRLLFYRHRQRTASPSEKPGHEGRADRQYIPSQAMHGTNRERRRRLLKKEHRTRLLAPPALSCERQRISQRPVFPGASRRRYLPHGTRLAPDCNEPVCIRPSREFRTRLSEQFCTDADRSTCLASLTGEAQHTSKSR
jgi:hypothetical protein